MAFNNRTRMCLSKVINTLLEGTSMWSMTAPKKGIEVVKERSVEYQ